MSYLFSNIIFSTRFQFKNLYSRGFLNSHPWLYLEFELCNKEFFFHRVSNLENKVNVIS